ncbi:MAG: LytR C-terminal domain-containing protein [Actinomycetota bacterium]|nr:LytR C-terminal domain-containing protein [Actinomycetota bacterium]
MTNYARDEFDRVPEAASRQGIHRAAAAPKRPRLWPILSVGTGALAVGVATFVLLPHGGLEAPGQSASEAAAVAESGSAEPGAASAKPSTAAPTAGASKPASKSAAASADPSEAAPSPAATEAASVDVLASTVDKALPVSIFNGTLTSGLAGRVGASVEADGWTLGQVANWQGAPQQTSVIFYSGAERKASAEALGKLLNITTLVESPGFESSVAVVLGPGFQ